MYIFKNFLKTNYTKTKGVFLALWERHAVNYSTSNSREYLCIWRSEGTSDGPEGVVLGSSHPGHFPALGTFMWDYLHLGYAL